MIWARVIQGLMNPVALIPGAILTSIVAYQIGLHVGHGRGVQAQIDAQAAANAQAVQDITERVRNALDQIGGDHSDADLDAILQDLAGE